MYRSFPHPHFDKPIPDPTDMPQGNKNLTQFLHLKKSFHDVIRDPAYEWEMLPIAQSLLKLRLENTKVKGKLSEISHCNVTTIIIPSYFESYSHPYKCELISYLFQSKIGDGASVVLECCPNLYSLGYLVFAAAGLKQVYGYEEEHDTKFTEVREFITSINFLSSIIIAK